MFAVFLFIALLESAASFHDSLNFIVPPRATQCFYEDFADAETVKTIDIFVQSGGKNAIEMEVTCLILFELSQGIFQHSPLLRSVAR